ncbi:MAG: DUF5107 domain-containing protein, partial [Bacilli bacterium]|nr:DUF5107 domain-containing protein [Bacilli bacterium]
TTLFRSQAKHYYDLASIGLTEPTDAMYYNDQPADMIYYQGLALIKLDRVNEAKARFNKLIDYGENHIFDNKKIDYFAVSLPDFLIFDTDLNKKNVAHCQYLIGLGNLGLGNDEAAKKAFTEVLKLDINHLGALTHIK